MQEFLILIIYQLIFKSIFIFMFWRSKNIPKKRTKKLRENAYNMEYIKRIHNRLDGAAYGYAIMQILLDLFIYKNEVINEDVEQYFKYMYIVIVLLLCVFPIIIIYRVNRIFDDTDKFEKKRMMILDCQKKVFVKRRTRIEKYKLTLGTLDKNQNAIICKKYFDFMALLNDDYELILYKGKPIDVARFKCVRG